MFDLDLIERALDDAVADAAELLERKLQEYAGREDNPHVALYRNAVILAKDARVEFAKLRKRPATEPQRVPIDCIVHVTVSESWRGKRVRLVVED